MPRRAHYRNAGSGGCGALILLLIVVGILRVIQITTSIPAQTWIAIVLLLLGAVAICGTALLVSRAIHKRQEQQILQQQAQILQQQAQIQLQQAQMYNLPPGRSISPETKIKVFNRDGGRCVQCGSPYDLQYDHIIPFSKGGGNGPENIQILCGPCNRKKSNNI